MNQSTLQVQIGQRVRAARQARGWSQEALAMRSGLHRAHISAIERGATNVTLHSLKTLADTLRVHIREFFPNNG